MKFMKTFSDLFETHPNLCKTSKDVFEMPDLSEAH